MFTGIIQELGSVVSVKSLGNGQEVTLSASTVLASLRLGDSISINGVCSTAIAFLDNSFTVQFLEETLKKSTFSNLFVGQKLNLELSLTPSTSMGGHFVSGHVDSVGTLVALDRQDPFGIVRIVYDPEWGHLLIPKGSITIDGISLTLVEVEETTFTCHLIPHTLDNTVLSVKKVGDQVNLEFDMIGKYLYHFFQKGYRHG